jgi:hypothetical protein
MSTAERAGSEGSGSGSAMSSRSSYRDYDAQGTDLVPSPPSEETRAYRPPRGEPKTVLRSSVKLGQRQLTLRRLDPWTILKLSVVFYTVVLLLVMLLLTLFWAFLNATGAVETVVGFANEAQLNVTYNAAQLAKAIFLLGLLGVVALSGINVFFCFLYNLVADLTGGLRLTIDDER